METQTTEFFTGRDELQKLGAFNNNIQIFI